MERHEDEGWQVKGPPLISSLQDVKPGTAEQSDETAQKTKELYWLHKCMMICLFYRIDRYFQHHKRLMKNIG